MSREIKFRAWSPYWKPAFLDGKPEAAMEYFKLGDLIGGYTPNCDIGVDEVDVVIMQYAGLKDKNGKEIYEGDIVRMYQHSIEVNPLYQRVGVVEFSEDRFMCWKATPHHFYLNGHLRDIPKSSYEVIGNIYESPELMREAS